MLENTFCHIPGIGPRLERRLWSNGIRSWREVSSEAIPGVSARTAAKLRTRVAESVAQLAMGNAIFFAERLASDQHWRLYSEFRKSTAYVDIETTGFGMKTDYITTIAIYDGTAVSHYVQGRNLEDFGRDIERYKLIVTYNGKCFDLPMIRRRLGVRMNVAHIDLRYVLRGLGFGGGLKGCERQIGIDRGALDGVDGYFAVLLWNDYLSRQNPRALETLLAYNAEDVVNLEALMVFAYNAKLRGTPFAASHEVPLPEAPTVPFKPDLPTIRRLRRRYFA